MKRVVPVMVFLMVAVLGFFVLIPEFTSAFDLQAYFRARMSPEMIRLDSIRDAKEDSLRLIEGAYERLLAIETVERLPATSARVTISAGANVPTATRAGFERTLRDELAPLGDSVRYPMRLHLVTDPLGKGGYVRIAVLPRTAGAPCSIVVLLPADAPREIQPQRGDRLSGPCGFYAAFGAPGRGMEEWLIATRGMHAATDRARPEERNATPQPMGPGDALVSPDAAGCLAGNDSLCTEAFAGYQWARRIAQRDSLLAQATSGTVRATAWSSSWIPGRNFSDLRDAMGEERFAQLWRSDKDPIAAYEEIEGRSIGHFVRDRLLLDVLPHRPGPLHADLPLALGLAVGTIAAILAIRLTKRQRSGP